MRKRKVVKYTIIAIFVIILTMLITFFTFYAVQTADAKLQKEKLPAISDNMQVFDVNGNDLTADYFASYVTPDELNDNLKICFTAIEDKRFFNHKGVDYYRIFGATFSNIKNRKLKEGASTITQQLIKNTHLTSAKTIKRKLSEIKLARELEKNYSKDEIFAMYLNVIYLGNGIYGVKDASHTFFDKDISEVSLAECAVLASIVKNPSKYSPINHYDNAMQRKNLVLRLAYEQKQITKEQYNKALAEDIKIVNKKHVNNNTIYFNNAINEACKILNLDKEKITKNKFKIYTYLDKDIQTSLEETISNKSFTVVNENGIYPNNSGIVLDNYSYGISGYYSNYKNFMTSVYRQPGSAAKPFVSYIPALENNIITMASPILDERTDFNGYSPHNFNDSYMGWTDVTTALSKSLNVPAVKLLDKVGVQTSKDFLEKIGWDLTENDNALAMALGGLNKGLTLDTLAGSYCTLANGGIYNKPTFIRKIEYEGKDIYNHKIKNDRVMSEENAYIITSMLNDCVKNGTLRKLKDLDFEIAGKTGTVASKDRNNTDSYSASYTSENTVVFWQGNLSNKPNRNLVRSNTGGSYATSQARSIYEDIYKISYPEDFRIPIDIIEKDIDLYSIEHEHEVKLASPLFPSKFKKTALFSLDNYPREYSTIFLHPEVENEYLSKSMGVYQLSFDAKSFINYDIYRKTFGSSEKIFSVEEYDGPVTIVDHENSSLFFVTYEICPYVKYDNEVKIYLKPKTLRQRK